MNPFRIRVELPGLIGERMQWIIRKLHLLWFRLGVSLENLRGRLLGASGNMVPEVLNGTIPINTVSGGSTAMQDCPLAAAERTLKKQIKKTSGIPHVPIGYSQFRQ